MEHKNRTQAIALTNALNMQWLKEQKYEYAWIQCLSNVYIGPLSDIGELDEEELLEARFFHGEAEIHVFPYDDSFKAIKTEKQSDDVELIRNSDDIYDILKEGKGDYFEEKQILRKGGTIILRHYLDCDNDGLARVSATVLCGYEGGHK